MERMLAGPAAALLFLAAAWAPASACEISPDYVRPSSFELVQISDSIVVATAREERKGDYDSPVVAFDVGEKVKGEAPPEVKVVGRLEPPAPDEHSGTSGPSVISVGGWCEPPPYRKGGRYLLFLQKGRDGQLRRNNHTLSPISEEYAGEDAAWMRRVRRYVRLQATAAPMDQIAILDRLADSRRGLAGEPLTAEEVRDIRDHLRSLSPFKPTAYLLAAYAALEQGRMPAHGVRRRGRDLAEMRRRVLSHLAKGDHPAAMPLFERLAAERPEDPDRIGLALRFFAKNGAYGRAFQWVETRLMKRLPQLAPAAARRLIGHVEQMQRGEEGEEPWRGDARAAALWPELALSLYWYQVRRFGPGDAVGFDDALRTLPHDDYRARPLLTLALAADYDQDITEWAMTELGDEAKRKAWEDLPDETRRKRADPAALPIRVLLSSWSQDR
ncbi:MAG TPA: hypothetical protein VEW26_10290, partial [Allosphingosinicella sp.]|nr:hypothetical protein [Allosphingosinicella sp.]